MPPLKRANIEIAKLKNALAYAEAIIEAIHEPLIVLHPDLRVRTANHAFYRVFHLVPAQTEEKEIYQISNGDWNIPELKSFFEKMSSSKVPIKDFELKHNFKNIGKRVMLLNARKLQMEGEEEGMILLVIVDITDRKKYEKQIEKEKNMLAENQRLQDISRQKDDFISMASHELKTPVTSIKAFAQLLEHDFAKLGNAEAAKMLSRMNIQIVKLTSLIGDLLDVTRMEGGKLQYHLAYFDFNEMIRDVVREVQLTTKIHTIKINLIKVPSIYGDKDRIGQVLTNLLSNAIKYSPQARFIDVSSKKDKEFVSVLVKDYGIGIRKEKQGKIFERFFRVNGIMEDTYPGLGLGLYISSEIIKRHNGTISINSIKGRGATFSFKLPLNPSIT
ncbi:MAG: PAS domain-containing sensor histidine kinase [Ginsengibacter sp.]